MVTSERTSNPSLLEFVMFLGISLFLLTMGFRVIALPFLLLWIYLWWFGSQKHYMRKLVCAWLLFFVTFFLPVDIDIANCHGRRRGVSPGGPHWVRLVKGLPMHSRLIAKYGEYISGGCLTSGLEPRWVLVWN
jgi:hypothetical protein